MYGLTVFHGTPKELKNMIIKKITLLTCLTMASLPTALHAGWFFSKKPKAEPVIDKAIACAADVVSQQKGGKAGLELVTSTLTTVMENLDDVAALNKTVFICKSSVKKLPRKDRVSPEIYMGMLNVVASKKHKGILKLLKGFVEPKMFCSTSGISAGFGVLAVGLGLRLNASSCRDSFGHKWWALGLGPQFQSRWIGLSAYSFHNDNDVQDYSARKVYTTSNKEKEFGSTAMMVGGWLPVLTQNIHGKNDKLLGQGLGVTLGSASHYSKNLNLSLPFVSHDTKYLRDILLGANEKTVEVDLYQ